MDLKFLQQPTLDELLRDWWNTADACRSTDSIVYDLTKLVENWMPSEQTYCGSQLPPSQESEIDGYNEALQLIRQRLRRRNCPL